MQKKPVVPQKTITEKRPGDGRLARTSVRAGRPARTGREEVGSRLAWMVGGGLALLVALLVGIGYYNDNVGPARTTAIQVGKQKLSLGYYRDRLRAATLQTGDGSQVDAFNKESTVTEALVDEQTYLQRAAGAGATVTDNDVTLQLAQLVRAPVADGKITDIPLYEAGLRADLQRTGLSLDQYRQIARAAALKQKVLDSFTSQVPKQALAIKGTELIFSSEQQGRDAQTRLGSGDTINDIAQDAVGNPSAGKAQPLDWTPVPFGILPAPLDDVASKLSPGEVSDLIKIDQTAGPQWVLLGISDRDPNHELSATQAQQTAQRRRAAWAQQQQKDLGVHSYVDGANARWAALHTGLPATAPPSPTPPSRPAGAPGANPGGLPALPSVPSGAPAGPQAGPTQPASAPVPNATP